MISSLKALKNQNIKLYLANFSARILARRSLTPTPCDVLFLVTWEGGVERNQKLADGMAARGFTTAFEVVSQSRSLVSRKFLRSNKEDSNVINLYDAIAAYVVAKYRPRIIVTFFSTANDLSASLKRRTEMQGGVHVNIAHSVLSSIDLNPFPDSHYLFVFGESSIEACRRASTLPPDVKVVKTGSIYIEDALSSLALPARHRLLFAANWIPKGCAELILPAYRVVSEWAKTRRRNYLLDVKPHPLNDMRLLKRYFANIKGVTILPREVSPSATFRALAPTSLLISPNSGLSLEAAVARRPSVIVGREEQLDDFLSFTKFFEPAANSTAALDAAVSKTLAEYSKYSKRAKDFADFHLEYQTDSMTHALDCLEDIIRNP